MRLFYWVIIMMLFFQNMLVSSVFSSEERWSYQFFGGIPIGAGIYYDMKNGFGTQLQGGYNIRFGGAWQVDLDITKQIEVDFLKYPLSLSVGPQFWTGKDGDWWGIRILPGIEFPFQNKKKKVMLTAGTVLFFSPEFAAELNTYIGIQHFF